MAYGPDRKEYRFRLIVSLLGLASIAGAVVVRGVSTLASLEIIVFGCLFFGGSAIWSGWKLFKGPDE